METVRLATAKAASNTAATRASHRIVLTAQASHDLGYGCVLPSDLWTPALFRARADLAVPLGAVVDPWVSAEGLTLDNVVVFTRAPLKRGQ
jgi:hypothetical protein